MHDSEHSYTFFNVFEFDFEKAFVDRVRASVFFPRWHLLVQSQQ